MDGLDVSAVFYAPPEELYEFVTEMRGYSKYSEYLDDVRQHGDGGPGTDYEIVVSWWRFSYTSHTRVTDVEPPERVDWRTTEGLRARGYWGIEPLPDAEVPADREHATRVRLRIQFDPESFGSVPLAGLTLDRLFERVEPLVVEEAERVVAGMTEDLEGERRDVDLEVNSGPESL